MQITFKTGKGELLFVKPEGKLFSHKIFEDMGDNVLEIKTEVHRDNTLIQKWSNIRIDKGFDLIGLSSEVTEEMAKELIPNSHYENIYPDYNFITDRMRAINFFNNALDSFKSILGHLEIDFNPIVLFKPNK